jgi:signal transduction histidine kinase
MNTYFTSFDRRESFELQYRLRRKDGEYRWILDIGVPRFGADSSFAGYIGSCIDVTDRKLAEEELASLSGRLIDAQEEERKRIAREIHDDYTQRVALVVNKLDWFIRHLQDNPPEADEEIRGIWGQLNELGTDLHSLSHRLHSSTLEALGLVAGIQTLCNEFRTRQELDVQFGCQNVPRDLSNSSSLCLFRIVQEALRNVKRHSGANRAEVRLESVDGELHLSVVDGGKGFDLMRQHPERGIGIQSMKERLRTIGGRLEVHSEPGRGTKIDAWVKIAS